MTIRRCASCRQTRVLPDLSEPANLGRWQQVESAKRQLFYTLARLGLEPVPGRPVRCLSSWPTGRVAHRC